MPPKVSIIILNWNGLEFTRDCLRSLGEIDYPSYDIIIVDNGSTDGSPEMIQREFPAVKLVRNSTNLGFAVSCNIGIREALKGDASYLLMLNNDVVLDRHFLSALVDAGEKDPKAGILTSKIYYFKPKDVLWFAGSDLNPFTGFYYHNGIGEKDNGQYDKVSVIGRASGCAMLIKRDVIERVGLFDEKFFLSGEDVDLSLRARKAGFNIVFVPGSVLWHRVSAATEGEGSPLNAYYTSRNMPAVWIRNGFFVRTHIWNFMRLLKNILFMMFPGKRNVAKAVIRGIIDFHLGRYGKRYQAD